MERSAVLLYTVRDGVATITLNRPDRRNAFTSELLRRCHDALLEARHDDEVRCVVLTGAGSAFCSGGDLDDMSAEPAALEIKKDLWEGMQAIPRLLHDLDKPVLAMMNGDAVGGGLDLALMCDVRVAVDTARMSTGYVRVGLVPGDGGAYWLPRLAPFGKAMELLLTGDFFSAQDAGRWGLVNHVVGRDQLEATTYELAGRIASLPEQAVRMTKRLAYQSRNLDLHAALDAASSHVAVLRTSEEHRARVRGLRRPPGPASGPGATAG